MNNTIMTDKRERISALANQCLLHKLSKPYYETDINGYYAEFQTREQILQKSFQVLLDLLSDEDFFQPSENASNMLSCILILYLELQSDITCKSKIENSIAKECAVKLNSTFEEKYKIKLLELLISDVFNAQEIFDITLKELHKRVTLDDFKTYPGLITVYCVLMENIKDFIVNWNPTSVLPISLILIDDYISTNKIKGLQCCLEILQCLEPNDFSKGNYYEVVYSNLKKNITEKDIDITKYLTKCLLELLRIIPNDVKKIKLADLFSTVLDQLHTESNLYRKVECLAFVTKIIQMHGIDCAKKKIFKSIICDNLDVCADEAVREIILENVIECLHTWIKYCWPIWKLSADQKLLSSLFKILYVCDDDHVRQKIQEIIIILISLCSEDEQRVIYGNLANTLKCSNEMFLKSIKTIKQNIKAYSSFIFIK